MSPQRAARAQARSAQPVGAAGSGGSTRPAFCAAGRSLSIAADHPCSSSRTANLRLAPRPLDYFGHEEKNSMSLHTTLQQADCRGAKCTPKSPAACRAAGVHTPRCGIDDGTHSSTPAEASRTRTRAHTHRTHAVRTHLPVGRADRVLRVPQGTACGCGCGGRGRA